VADGVEAVVEQSVVPREAVDRVRAAVVLLTAAVRRQHVAVRLAGRRHVPGAAPASARHDQTHASTTSTSLRVRRRGSFVPLLLALGDGRYRFVCKKELTG